MKIRTLTAVAFSTVALFAAPMTAWADSAGPGADEGFISTSVVTPANNTVISSTPRGITVRFDDAREATAAAGSVRLIRAISGNEVESAGETVTSGDTVVFAPPALEAGTYILTWSSGDGLFSTTHRSVFSVGSPDVPVTGAAEQTTSPLSWPARVLGVILAIGAGFLAARRRVGLAALTGTVALVASSAAVLPTGWVTTLVAAPGLVLLAALAGAVFAKGPWTLITAMSGSALIGLVLVAAAGVISGGTSAFGSLTWLGAIILTAGALIVVVALTVVGLLASQRGQSTARAGVIVLTSVSLIAGIGAVVADPSGGKVLGGRALQLSADVDGCLASGTTLDQSLCLEQLYTLKVESLGVKPALDDLGSATQANGQMRSYCHGSAHAIGRAAFRVTGGIAKAFETGYDVCDFGYYHGIIEAAGGDADDDTFRGLVPTLCGELATSSQIFFEQCAHGLGHAAARRANNDMAKGLSFCEALDDAELLDSSRREQALNGCGTGVTMEWFALRGLPGADEEDFIPVVQQPRDACSTVAERWMDSCYEYVGNLVGGNDKFASLSEIANWCNDTGHVSACYKGVARAAGGVRLTDEQAIELCAMANQPAAITDCAAMLLYTIGATVEYQVGAVDRVCSKFPSSWNTAAVCATVRVVVDESLNGTRDGKGAPSVGSSASPAPSASTPSGMTSSTTS